MRFMALLTTVIFLSSCSWIPWRNSDTGNCLDDGTCDEGNPLQQAVIEGTWYCYGKSKDDPWDCGIEPDNSKIVAITDEPRPRPTSSDQFDGQQAAQPDQRAEISFDEETISTPARDPAPEPTNAEASSEPTSEPTTEAPQQEELEAVPEELVTEEAVAEQTVEESLEEATEEARQEASEARDVATDAPTPEIVEPVVADAPTPESIAPAQTAASIDNSQNPVLSHPDNAYAVQLIALQTLEEAETFAQGYELDDPIFVSIESQGSDWYVVILDILPDKIQADRVARDWEQEHNPLSRPWVRPLGPLKRAITTR